MDIYNSNFYLDGSRQDFIYGILISPEVSVPKENLFLLFQYINLWLVLKIPLLENSWLPN